MSGGLAADEAYIRVREERVEQADGVRSPSDARDRGIGQAAGSLEDLTAGLHADDALEIADHGGEGMGPGGSAEDVVRGLDVGDPVPERLVDGVFESTGAGGNRYHRGTEHLHPCHVDRLPADVRFPHVDGAFQAEQRACRRGSHPVLAGSRLRDNARLAHPRGQQGLPEHVVDLV